MIDYSATPVNKTASIVTSQSGCATDDTLTDEQKRENLVSRVKNITALLESLPKKSKERKALGKIKYELQLKINAIRPAKKCKNLSDYVLDVLREELTEFKFRSIIEKASLLAAAAQEDK